MQQRQAAADLIVMRPTRRSDFAYERTVSPMKLPVQIRADILKTLMQEDRNEIRLLKDRIYTICTFLTVSSFAITSFFFSPERAPGYRASWGFLLLIDVSIIVLLWVVFARLKIDLTNARKCLQVRERIIRNLDETSERPFDPTPDASKETLTITENGLYWIVSLATLALILKLVLIRFGLMQ